MPFPQEASLYSKDLVQFYCGPDEYNMLASLFLSPSEVRADGVLPARPSHQTVIPCLPAPPLPRPRRL